MSGAARMIRNIMTLGIWTLVSRGAGLARDLMMANYLGAGAVGDASVLSLAEMPTQLEDVLDEIVDYPHRLLPRGMVIGGVHVLEKRGGKSGEWVAAV